MLKFPKANVLLNISGFETDIVEQVVEASKITNPDFIILGLGARKQEQVAIAIAREIKIQNSVLIATCGGWLDQLVVPNYYPRWAYPLKLNWLVRLVREPKRLWRRYSVDVARILLALPLLRKLKSLQNIT
jgi:exopolysaccharide biosynthesis WecB/TagA/CpsF family protein